MSSPYIPPFEFRTLMLEDFQPLPRLLPMGPALQFSTHKSLATSTHNRSRAQLVFGLSAVEASPGGSSSASSPACCSCTYDSDRHLALPRKEEHNQYRGASRCTLRHDRPSACRSIEQEELSSPAPLALRAVVRTSRSLCVRSSTSRVRPSPASSRDSSAPNERCTPSARSSYVPRHRAGAVRRLSLLRAAERPQRRARTQHATTFPSGPPLLRSRTGFEGTGFAGT